MKKFNLRIMAMLAIVVFPIIIFAQGAVGVLSAPTGINASTLNTSQINISWEAVRGARLYNIYRNTSDTGSFTKINSSETTSYNDTNLPCAVMQYYYVTAADKLGESKPSSHISARTSECEATPIPKLQKKWETAKKSYIKSFNSLISKVTNPTGSTIKKILKYKSAIIIEDAEALVSKASTIKAFSTNEKATLEQDKTIIKDTTDLSTKKAELKAKVNQQKTQIKNIYTEINLFRKIKVYEDTKKLGAESYSTFREICPQNTNVSVLKEKVVTLESNITNVREKLNTQKYKEANSYIKLCKSDAKTITKLIKLITTTCGTQ